MNTCAIFLSNTRAIHPGLPFEFVWPRPLLYNDVTGARHPDSAQIIRAVRH